MFVHYKMVTEFCVNHDQEINHCIKMSINKAEGKRKERKEKKQKHKF